MRHAFSALLVLAAVLAVLTCACAQPEAGDLIRAGSQAQSVGDWADAINCYTGVLELFPDNPTACMEAQDGLIECYRYYAPTLLTRIPFPNSGFESDADGNGTADGWSFTSTSPGVECYLSGLNKIRNGGFDGYDTATLAPLGWTPIGAGLQVAPSPHESQRGEKSLAISSVAEDGIYQRIDGLQVGTAYRYRCLVSGDFAPIAVDPNGGADPTAPGVLKNAIFTGAQFGRTSQWKQYEIKWTAQSPGATVFVLGGGSGLVDCAAVGIEVEPKGHPIPMFDPVISRHPFIPEGKTFQVIDLSGVRGTSGRSAPVVTSVISRGIEGCVPGVGCLFSVPLLLLTTVAESSPFSSIRVGIDPTGGADYRSAAVVWSAPCDNKQFMRKNAWPWPVLNNVVEDHWRPFFVSAAADSSRVTLFIRIDANPDTWGEYAETTLLIDDAALFAGQDPAVLGGFASGGTGDEIADVYGRFAAVRALRNAVSSAGLSAGQKAWAKVWLAAAKFALGDLQASRDLLDSIDPTAVPSELHPWLDYNRSCALHYQAFEERDALAKVIADYPSNAYTRVISKLRLGRIAFTDMRWESAKQFMAQVLDDPDADVEAKALANLYTGMCYVFMKCPASERGAALASAAKHLSTAAPGLGSIPPLQAQAIMLAAYMHSSSHNDAAAKELALQVESKASALGDCPEIRVWAKNLLADIAEREGKDSDALAILRQLKDDPVLSQAGVVNAQSLFDLARLEKKLGSKDAALAVIDELVGRYPEAYPATRATALRHEIEEESRSE